VPLRLTHILLLIGVLLLALVPRALFISGTSPYPMHEDEALIAVPAARMLKRGELNPHWFKYPSLPIYLTAAGLAAGRVIDGDTDSEVGRVGRPYYDRPAVMETARYLFAVLSVAVFAMVGLLAFKATGEPWLLSLAPLLLLVSDRFLIQSWTYLNVDIVGALVCTGALAYAFCTRGRTSLLHRALLPGLLTGLAVGSKYYLGLVGLPFALLLFEREHRPQLLKNAGAIVAATILGFLISTPYALLDSETFVEHLVFEVEHYSEGHAGGDGEPGLSQLVYYGGQLHKEFGYGLLAFALIGLVGLVKRDRKSALLLLSFPVALLVFLATQRVHFPRNIISIYAVLPILAAYGLSVCVKSTRESKLAHLGPVLVVVALVLTVPHKRIRASYSIPADSRTRAAEWIEANRPDGSRVYIADELQMDTRELEAFDVHTLPLTELVRPDMIGHYAKEDPVFVLPESLPGSRFARTFGKTMEPTRALTQRAKFGRNPVPRRTTRLVHMGDPRLQVLGLPGPSSGEGADDSSSR